MEKGFTMESFAIWVIGIGIGIAVTYLLCRWIFGINKILYRLKANNELLAQIAKQQGVDPKIVDGIIDKCES